MDLVKFLALFTIYLWSQEWGVVEGGKKFRGHGWGWGGKHPVKPLFGVGIGYKKVVSYKPILLIQKHKHIKVKRPGWGWQSHGGWKPHGHGHGHGKGHKGGGGGWKQIDHHHFHHDDGWGNDQGGGWGWGDDDHDEYGGYESNVKANWTSQHPENLENHKSFPPDQLQSGFLPEHNQQLPPVERGQMLRDHHQYDQAPSSENNSSEEDQIRGRGYQNFAVFNMGRPPKGQSVPIIPIVRHQRPRRNNFQQHSFPKNLQQFRQLRHF